MNMIIKNFLKRIWTDFKKKEFLPLKLLYFLVFGGLFTVFPFMTIQARSLGIREEEYGTILGVLPIFFFLGSSIIGIAADKMGNFKILCSFTMGISGLTSLAFLIIPVARITHKFPDELPLLVTCSSTGISSMKLKTNLFCDYVASEIYTAHISNCRYRCDYQSNESNARETTDISLDVIYTTDTYINQSDDYPSSNRSEGLFRPPLETRTIQFKRKNSSDLDSKITDYSVCSNMTQFQLDNIEYNIYPSANNSNETCWSECDAHIPSQELCLNDVSVEEFDPGLTIGLYILARMIHAFSLVFALPLFEGAALAVLQERRGDIGLQRLYSNIGQVVMTPISGALMDAFSSAEETNFRPAFYLYITMTLLSALCIMFIDLEFKKPAKQISKELKILLTNFEVIIFITFGLIAGIAHGVIDTFLFWLLQNMGASKSMMGLTVTVGSSFGIIIMIFATPIIERIGHVNAITLGFVFFVVRLVGYSLIQNPWLAMPFEAMECFTSSLAGVAQLSYAVALSTPTTLVTLQTLTMGTMNGFGRGVGGLIGGFLSKSVGLRASFQIIAGLCGFSAVVYFVLNIIVFRKRERERKIQKEKDQNIKKKENATHPETDEEMKAPSIDLNENIQEAK